MNLHTPSAAIRAHGAEAGSIHEFQPETANTVPSIEGINEPLVTVAADANAGGENVAAHDFADHKETGCVPVEGRHGADRVALGSDVETVALPIQTIPVHSEEADA